MASPNYPRATLLGLSLLLLTVVSGDRRLSDDHAWTEWKLKHAKAYSSPQAEARGRLLWTREVEAVARHNKAFDEGREDYRQAVYGWADQGLGGGRSCFKAAKNKLLDGMVNASMNVSEMRRENLKAIPISIDYRSKGYVTSVDEQGKCGACWAFAVAGAVEALHKKQTNKLEKLSAQQLIDCSAEGDGCKGWSTAHAMLYGKIYGFMKASEYPYAEKHQTCKYALDKVVFRFTNMIHHASLDEPDLEVVLANVGPVATSIVATPSFHRFKGNGIFSTTECNPSMEPNHSLLIVGYGVDSTSHIPYWIVKNSHGTDWGDEGFARIVRGKSMCGIGKYSVWPLA